MHTQMKVLLSYESMRCLYTYLPGKRLILGTHSSAVGTYG